MLPVMIPRTPASGRFFPVTHKAPPPHSPLHSTSFSSTPSPPLPPRTLSYPPSTPSPTSDIDHWKFDAETQLDRLISQAEFTLSQQRLLPSEGDGGGETPLTPWQEREMREFILRFHQLKKESQSTLHSIQQQINEEKTKTDSPPSSPPPTPPSPTYLASLEGKLSSLQSAYDSQQLELIAAASAMQAHGALMERVRGLEGEVQRLEGEADGLGVTLREERVRGCEVQERLQEMTATAEMWEVEYKRERAQRLDREREVGEERVRRKKVEMEGREWEEKERRVRGEAEEVRGEMQKLRRVNDRLWGCGVLGLMTVVLLLVLDKGMKAWMKSYGAYTF